MPIDYKEYHPKWEAISRFIRFYRARNRCEWCGAPNGLWINRLKSSGEWFPALQDEEEDEEHTRPVRIVLTVAHLDHDIANNHPSNLLALCQQCHLRHDAAHHAQNRRKKVSP